MATYTYAPLKPKPPKGQWPSIYGGYERTPFAGYKTGPRCSVSPLRPVRTAEQKRAAIRARKLYDQLWDDKQLERELQASLDALDESIITKEFYNG